MDRDNISLGCGNNNFFVLICDDWTMDLCWIPLVSGFFAPFLIWITSWVLYAFGEMVENISKTNDIAEKQNIIHEILLQLQKDMR